MHQVWHDLLFAHWPIDASRLRALIPASLAIDTFEGQAWIAVVPFRMSGIRPRRLPAVPWLSAFPELNVRTYVIKDGKPGVWFFSLDAANPIAVSVARAWFHLPYFRASMVCQAEGDNSVRYNSVRTHAGAAPARFSARYRPTGPPFEAAPGSLEYFLTARYCLYAAAPDGRLFRGDIDHDPWPLQPAEAEFASNSMADWLDIPLTPAPALLHFSRRIAVRVWALTHQSPLVPPAA